MIIADLHLIDDERVTPSRVYLSAVPFPGDVIATFPGRPGGGKVMVIRRTFLDLGPDTASTSERLSINLEVRPL